MNGITVAMERKAELSNASPGRYTGLRAAAQSLSLRNVDAATCELMNEALARLVLLAYEQDAGGYCNIDAATGKLLIPLPWGRNGSGKWGLRPQEANILRQVLFDWMEAGPCLLEYDPSRKSWFVNLGHFPNAHIARAWLRDNQITVGLYRAARIKRLGGV